ncbi:two-component regulator propeller domain-containing protein [uncultured Chitinophaga sp.]|uniref:ligand-binding sensor domain-containing protein n=1 Tax=uncultured Chitinophaga sp. TaxID=339340 RepID=UPI0025D0D6E1|nr:two-component regulator propeller domain-containing protein [uncultured Chitinophaga sp.]
MFHFWLKVALCCLLCVAKVNAQPYYFRHYQVENGLSNNTVFSSVQDEQGFMWFGTKEGLNRFDGYRFKLYRLDERGEQRLDQIYNLYKDARGTLWIGSQKGLYYFDAINEKPVNLSDTLREVWSLTSDNRGQLWFVAQNTLCRYNPVSKTVKRFRHPQGQILTAVCITSDGAVWTAADNGYVHQFDTATGVFTPYDMFSHSPPGMVNCYIHRIKAAGMRIMVCTSCEGVKEFDVATRTYKDLLTYNTDHTNVYAHDILQTGENEFWVASESGVHILNSATSQSINLHKKFLDPYSLTDNAVYTISRDNEGGIWVGTYFGGVNYYARPYTPFRKYYPDYSQNAISGSAVREIQADSEGQLWIGTEDAGLNRLNPVTGSVSRFTPLETPNSITYSNIHGVLVNGNEVWAGTHEHGLDIIDRKTGRLLRHYYAGKGPKDLKHNFIVSLLKTRNNTIYLGTGAGLERYDAAAKGFDKVNGPANYTVSSLIEDHSGVIWGTTHQDGVFSYDPVTGRSRKFHYDPEDIQSISSNTSNAVCEDAAHNIWFATEGGGLCKMGADRQHFTRYTVKDGLPSNFLFKIVEDKNHRLWVSTSKGLVLFDTRGKVLAVYTQANGLLNDQFNYNSGYRDANGHLYFGSIKGMISFDPDAFIPNTFEPPVYVTGFQVHNNELAINKDSNTLKKSIVLTDDITLAHDASSFSIDFAALSYNAPDITAYKYMMDGLDKDWTFLKTNRKVYFTNLSPGTYTFRIKASTNGNWGGGEKQLTIHILPPFWATTWAYLLYFAVLAAICYYVISFYHKRTQDKKEREIYEAKIEFFTNVTHEIRTPLTLIKGPVENLLEKVEEVPDIKPDVLTLERNTNRLIALITQILDFRQTEARGFSLNFSEVRIDKLLQEEYENFIPPANKKKLQYQLVLPEMPITAVADEEALRKILSNLLNNGVKYAAQTVTVILRPLLAEDATFTIEVQNDGNLIPAEMKDKIFEPFYRMKETSRQTGSGIGLSIARSLAVLHRGRLYLNDNSDGLNIFILNLPLKADDKQSKETKTYKTASH